METHTSSDKWEDRKRPHPTNPRELIINIFENDPEISMADGFVEFQRGLEGRDDLQRDVDYYFYAYVYGSFHKQKNMKRRGNGKHKAAAMKRAAEKMAAKARAIIIADHMLAIGKTVREATFADLAKEGGRFTKLSKLGKPTQIVGKVLDDEAIQKAWIKPA